MALKVISTNTLVKGFVLELNSSRDIVLNEYSKKNEKYLAVKRIKTFKTFELLEKARTEKSLKREIRRYTKGRKFLVRDEVSWYFTKR